MPRHAHVPPSSPSWLELACFSAESAISVLSNVPVNTVSRIELCSGPQSSGGWTPSLESLFTLKEYLTRTYSAHPHLAPPVNAMIRPRNSSDRFTITPEEFEQMKLEIKACAGLADGFVFGILEEMPIDPEAPGEGWDAISSLGIDEQRNKTLVMLADGKPCTFHRAFDKLVWPEEEADTWDDVDRPPFIKHNIDVLLRCGFTSVLTGGKEGGTALEGTSQGALQIINKEGGDRGLEVIIGGGIRMTNSVLVIRALGNPIPRWWHSSCITKAGSEEADAVEVHILAMRLRYVSLRRRYIREVKNC